MKRMILVGRRFGKTAMMLKYLKDFEYTQEEQAFIDQMVSNNKVIASVFQITPQEIGEMRMKHGKEV